MTIIVQVSFNSLFKKTNNFYLILNTFSDVRDEVEYDYDVNIKQC